MAYENFGCFVHVSDDTGGIIWPEDAEGPDWCIGKYTDGADHVTLWVFNEDEAKWEPGEDEHVVTAMKRMFHQFPFNPNPAVRKITPSHLIATFTRMAAAAHSKAVFIADKEDRLVPLKVHPASARGEPIRYLTLAGDPYDLDGGQVLLTRCANPPTDAEKQLAERVFAKRLSLTVAKRHPPRDASKGRVEDHNWSAVFASSGAVADPVLTTGKRYTFKIRKDGVVSERTGTCQGDDMVLFVAPDGTKRVVRFPPQDAELVDIKLLDKQTDLLQPKTGLSGKDMETWAPFMGTAATLQSLRQELFRVFVATGVARRERAIEAIMRWATKAGPDWEANEETAADGRQMLFDLRVMVTASTERVKEEDLRKKVMASFSTADVFDVAAEKMHREERRGGGGGGGGGYNGGRDNRGGGGARGGQGQAGARERLCHHCQKPGHLIAACLSKKAGKPKAPAPEGNRQRGPPEDEE